MSLPKKTWMILKKKKKKVKRERGSGEKRESILTLNMTYTFPTSFFKFLSKSIRKILTNHKIGNVDRYEKESSRNGKYRDIVHIKP